MERRTAMTKRDQVIPEGAWKFDEKVADVFDDMLARSIPDYIGMRRSTTELASRFIQPRTAVVDLGCSRGAALAPLVEKFKGNGVSFVGVEVSEPMREAAKKAIPEATVLDLDLRTDYPSALTSVTLAVLTLQFVPIEYRQRILQDAFDHTVAGGAILLVEKVLGSDAYADNMLVETYLARKGENGYTAEQIQTKRESLEGVLVPVTAHWNVDLLERSGFKHVECYWRHLNFAAWIGIKP
jgi:tRNA (cmo5U34)-methyltransferase